jgi:hypothetical protein
VILIQWVDDAGDIVNGSTLGVIVDGTTLSFTVNAHDTAASQDNAGVVFWQAGPFARPLVINTFEISDMAEGHMHVWVA